MSCCVIMGADAKQISACLWKGSLLLQSCAGVSGSLASSEDRDNVCPGGAGVQTPPRTRSCSPGTWRQARAGISIPSRSCLLWPLHCSCTATIIVIPLILRTTWEQQQSHPQCGSTLGVHPLGRQHGAGPTGSSALPSDGKLRETATSFPAWNNLRGTTSGAPLCRHLPKKSACA